MSLLLTRIPSQAIAFTVGLLLLSAAAGASTISVFDPADLVLVEEIDCSQAPPAGRFAESEPNASYVDTILSRGARVLDPSDDARWFAYKVGTGEGLVSGQAYVLQIDYAEDTARSIAIVNRGAEVYRGLHTGRALGDTLHGYGHANPESLDLPLSDQWETWENLFWLHDRTAGLTLRRGTWNDPLDRDDFPNLPDDGFWVIIAHHMESDTPVSDGAAISRIRLYSIAEPDAYDTTINLPPNDLPHRYVFWREEMADRIVDADLAGDRAVADATDYFEYKMKLARFLGINTFSKDLLEFGHNQGFDAEPYGGADWFVEPDYDQRWQLMLDRVSTYGLSVMPYFEWAGSTGDTLGLGRHRRAEPLNDKAPHFPDYTDVAWSETWNVDITDPAAAVDLERLLDTTIVRHAHRADFIGAWLRTRNSHIPIGFADETRLRFSRDLGLPPVSRADLINDQGLRNSYYEWWLARRADFLAAAQDWLAGELGNDPVVLLTTDHSEAGKALPGPRAIVNDHTSTWSLDIPQYWTNLDQRTVLEQERHLTALTSPEADYGSYENSHSTPWADPQRYIDDQHIALTYGFHRAYSTSSPHALSAFDTLEGGGLALVRHHFLNEDRMITKAADESGAWYEGSVLGYTVFDFERTGSFSMMAEALAIANGNPRYIGYLVGNNFNRGFPSYVRRFNRAFLSLPALPSTRLAGAASHDDVAVRRILTESDGTWFAVVNTSAVTLEGVTVEFGATGELTDAATNTQLAASAAGFTFDLYPYELRSVHLSSAPDTSAEDPLEITLASPLSDATCRSGTPLTVEATVNTSRSPGASPTRLLTDPTHLRLTADGAAYQHLKIGYSSDHIHAESTSPTAGGQDTLVLELRDFAGGAQWDELKVRTPDGSEVIIGTYLVGDAADWTEVQIPVSVFGATSFDNISYLSVPFTTNDQSLDLGISRIEFTGGSGPVTWFGEGHTTNATELGNGMTVELVQGDGPEDPSGNLRVTLFRDGEVLLRRSSPPYQVTWTPDGHGPVEIFAVVEDGNGNRAVDRRSIFVQSGALFEDDFESGGVTAWFN